MTLRWEAAITNSPFQSSIPKYTKKIKSLFNLMFVITVTGDIIATDKKHYAQNWACRTTSSIIKDTSYSYNKDEHSIQSNLILNKNIRAVPYAIYASEKGIRTESFGEIYAAPGAMAAHLCYKDNISEIEYILQVSISPEIEIYFYNGLLTGIFSILELFMSDVLLCIIFRNREVYDRSLDYLIKNKEMKNGEKVSELDQDLKIQRYFTQKIVYHNFKKTGLIFEKILQIQLPDTKGLSSYLYKRNNIAHRFSYSNIDRMSMTEINVDILNDLINNCNDFVEKLMKEIYKVY